MAWRLFVISHPQIGHRDVELLASASKLLILAYLNALLGSPSPAPQLLFHHGLTIALLMLAQEAGYATKSKPTGVL